MANTAGRATRELLILTAERLFAERGVDAVSLREIGTVAEQRNAAVINYYFGDREGLMQAIFAYRRLTLLPRFEALIDEAVATTRAGEVERTRRLLEAFTLPFFEQLHIGYFVPLIARLQTDFGKAERYSSKEVSEALDRLFASLRAEHPNLDDVAFTRRVQAIYLMAIHALATHKLLGETVDLSDEDFLTDLIDVEIGILEAASTMSVRRGSRRRSGRVATSGNLIDLVG
jgi:AcrR family transcriptional regulator